MLDLEARRRSLSEGDDSDKPISMSIKRRWQAGGCTSTYLRSWSAIGLRGRRYGSSKRAHEGGAKVAFERPLCAAGARARGAAAQPSTLPLSPQTVAMLAAELVQKRRIYGQAGKQVARHAARTHGPHIGCADGEWAERHRAAMAHASNVQAGWCTQSDTEIASSLTRDTCVSQCTVHGMRAMTATRQAWLLLSRVRPIKAGMVQGGDRKSVV